MCDSVNPWLRDDSWYLAEQHAALVACGMHPASGVACCGRMEDESPRAVVSSRGRDESPDWEGPV
jgi:hypothetical protein